MAEKGYRVLIIDMDAQGAVSHGFGVVSANGITLSDALARDSVDLGKVVCPTAFGNAHVIPADERLREVELGLAGKFGREQWQR